MVAKVSFENMNYQEIGKLSKLSTKDMSYQEWSRYQEGLLEDYISNRTLKRSRQLPTLELMEAEVKDASPIADEPLNNEVETKTVVETTTVATTVKPLFIKSGPLASSVPPINLITQQDTSGLKLKEPEPNVKAPDLKIETTTTQDAVSLKKPPDKPRNEWTTILSKYNRDKDVNP